MPEDDPYEYDDPYDDKNAFGNDESDPYDGLSEPIDGNPNASAPPPYPQPTRQGGPNRPPDLTGAHCSVCGYNLSGSAVGGFCPECGSSIEKSLLAGGDRPNPGLAIASMVLGILSILLFCCCGWVLGIIGLALGIVALMQLPDTPQARGARGMALAGVICSAISLTLGLVMIIINVLSSIL